MSTPIRTTQTASDSELLAGLTQNQATLPSMLLNGATTTPAQCLALVQSRISAADAVVTTKAAWQKAVLAHRTVVAQTKPVVDDLRQQLTLMYHTSPDILAAYGLTPRKKPAVQTTPAKMVAAEKRLATRKERGTKGSRQKAKVVGSLPAALTVSVPNAGPPAVSPEPAPANASSAPAKPL
jgi:hypothetical protein